MARKMEKGTKKERERELLGEIREILKPHCEPWSGLRSRNIKYKEK